MDARVLDRREVLGAVGLAGAAALAGCLGRREPRYGSGRVVVEGDGIEVDYRITYRDARGRERTESGQVLTGDEAVLMLADPQREDEGVDPPITASVTPWEGALAEGESWTLKLMLDREVVARAPVTTPGETVTVSHEA